MVARISFSSHRRKGHSIVKVTEPLHDNHKRTLRIVVFMFVVAAGLAAADSDVESPASVARGAALLV